MKRLVFSVFFGTLAMAGASAAQAEPHALNAWQAAYRPLPIQGGAPVVPLPLDGAGRVAWQWSLPFDVRFDGAAYSRINVGQKGYVTFGANDVTNGVNNLDTNTFLGAGAPTNLIAVWWGDHFCDDSSGELSSQVIGHEPRRSIVIQWHCSLREASGGSLTRFEAQLWLFEGEDFFRVSYGRLSVGVEDFDHMVWGIKRSSSPGIYGLDRGGQPAGCASGSSTAACTGVEHFPHDTTLQYGLAAGAAPVVSAVGATFSTSGQGLSYQIASTILNLGSEDAAAGYELHLARNVNFVPGAPGSLLLKSASGTVLAATADAPGQATFVEEGIATPPPGGYHACALLQGGLGGTSISCSQEVVYWGVDLAGAILSSPEAAAPGASIALRLSLENVGLHDAGAFGYRIELVPDDLPVGLPPASVEELASGRVDGLAAGSTLELVFEDERELRLPAILRGDRYSFVLHVDPAWEASDLNPSNNVAYAPRAMDIHKASFSLRRTELSFAEGECFYGESMSALLEVCNAGPLEAVGHHPGVAMGPLDNMSRINDVVAASSPQSCDMLSSNFLACGPRGDQPGLCLEETCRYACSGDGDCGVGERCLADPLLAAELGDPAARSCGNVIAAYEGGGIPCQTYRMEGRVPFANQRGRPYDAGPQRFHFIGDMYTVLSEPLPFVHSTAEVVCQVALPDLAATSLDTVQEMVAGETYSISRRIQNLQLIEQVPGEPRVEAVEFRYAYYLAPLGTEMSHHQIPLPIVGADDLSLGRKGESLLADRVLIPEQLAPGEYQLGLIVDPNQQVREISRANNVLVFTETIRIAPPSFGIVAPSMPTAILGAPYLYQFTASGGVGSYSWSAEGLPPGLELDARGRLFGAPREVGVFAFKLRARAGDRSSERIVALRVLGPAALLEVSTHLLPPAARLRPYGGWIDANGQEREGIPMVASGGVPPYRWELDASDGRTPQGILFDAPEGILRGEPTPLSESSSFTVKVIDANGSWATRRLELVVVDGDDLVIASRLFSEGITGLPYESCIGASGGDPEAPLTWEVESSTIPPGLTATTRGRSACLEGSPTACGNYLVRASVEDPAGRRYTSTLSLSVECGLLQLKRRHIPELRRGETIEIQLEADLGAPAFRLEQGSLPQGLTLSDSGTISGTVDPDAQFGPYNLYISMRDPQGRHGMAAVVLRVRSEPRVIEAASGTAKSGCSGAGGGLEAWVVIAACAMIALRARPRRLVEVRGSSSVQRMRRRAGLPSARCSGPLAALLGVSLLLGAPACGSDEEDVQASDAADLCEEVFCAVEGLSCDPADGLCKCGGAEGIFCTGDQRCTLQPEPACSSGMCDFVECTRGESCDRETGACSCGGVSCEESEVCIAGVCRGVDRCLDVRCEAGAQCDPDDGKCKCGGAQCLVGESCIEGSCKKDRCSGVSCPTNSACNPDDGQCHCDSSSGPICQAGQACVPSAEPEVVASTGEGFVCVESDRCEGVSCGGGTTCDPADGLCRCGGVGVLAPACTEGQTCIDGQCKGGDLCMPGGVQMECPRGLSCDPKNGECKCGGLDGIECAEGETCTYGQGVYACREACTIVVGAGGTCGFGEGCYIDRDLGSGVPVCAAVGGKLVNQDCETFNDCAPGLYCSRANKCRRFCKPSEGDLSCADSPGSVCLPFLPSESAQSNLGYCIADPG